MASRSLNSLTAGGDEKLPRQAALLRLSAQFPGTGVGQVHSGGWTEGTIQLCSQTIWHLPVTCLDTHVLKGNKRKGRKIPCLGILTQWLAQPKSWVILLNWINIGGSLRAIWLQNKYCYWILCTCSGQGNDHTPSPCLPVAGFGEQPGSISHVPQHRSLCSQGFRWDPAGTIPPQREVWVSASQRGATGGLLEGFKGQAIGKKKWAVGMVSPVPPQAHDTPVSNKFEFISTMVAELAGPQDR